MTSRFPLLFYVWMGTPSLTTTASTTGSNVGRFTSYTPPSTPRPWRFVPSGRFQATCRFRWTLFPRTQCLLSMDKITGRKEPTAVWHVRVSSSFFTTVLKFEPQPLLILSLRDDVRSGPLDRFLSRSGREGVDTPSGRQKIFSSSCYVSVLEFLFSGTNVCLLPSLPNFSLREKTGGFLARVATREIRNASPFVFQPG